MKRIILLFIMALSLCLTSCSITTTEATASGLEQVTFYYDYTYNNVTYPVIYINSYPHYYCNGHWIIVPSHHHHYITHHGPLVFRGHYPYQHYRHVPNTYYNYGHRYQYTHPIHPHNYNGHGAHGGQHYRQQSRPQSGQFHGNSQRQTPRGGRQMPTGGRR